MNKRYALLKGRSAGSENNASIDDNKTDVDELEEECDENKKEKTSLIDDEIQIDENFCDELRQEKKEDKASHKRSNYTRDSPSYNGNRYAMSKIDEDEEEENLIGEINNTLATGKIFTSSSKKDKTKPKSYLGVRSYPLYLSLSSGRDGSKKYEEKMVKNHGIFKSRKEQL